MKTFLKTFLLIFTFLLAVHIGAPTVFAKKPSPTPTPTPTATPTPTPAPTPTAGGAGDAGEAALDPTAKATVISQGNGTVTTSNGSAPMTWLGVSTGAVPQVDETTNAVDGVNHDYFILYVGGQPGDWAGKQISVKIDWTNPAADYDLHVHKDTEFGPEVYTSAGGAPSTEEAVSINPATTGTGIYYLNVGYFSAPSTPNTPPPGNYQGTIALTTSPVFRTASYTHGGMTFSKNTPTKAGTAASDGEPSSRVDQFGNYYVCGIRGVPAGVDLWYFDLRPGSPTYDPNMRAPLYRGQPDSPTALTPDTRNSSAGALGGGDIDLAVGFGNYSGSGATANPVPVLAYSSLTAANLTTGRSLDRGATFQLNAAGNLTGGVPVNDRQWMGFLDDKNVYLDYRNFVEGIAFVQRSSDGGLTYGPAVVVGNLPQTGALDVDRTTGIVYISGNNGDVAIGVPASPSAEPSSYSIHHAIPSGVDSANIFFPIRVGGDGTLYGSYSDGKNIFLVSSADHGTTWTAPVQVNDPADATTKTNLMPWLAAGANAGSVGVAWYGTDNDSNDDNARWRLYYAVSFNANSATPGFQIAQASDHAIHAANISLKGLPLTGPSPNRNLLDYMQINFDPAGAAIIGFTDDHNDFDGNTYVTRQLSGPSIKGNKLRVAAEGAALPAQPFAAPGTLGTNGGLSPQPMQPGPNGEQVTDFAQDQDSGLLAVTPTNSPIDIISIKYTSDGNFVSATMKVSDLTVLPSGATWRMYFTANAAETGIVGITGNQYSKGLSDRGDQFYIEGSISALGAQSASWGTVVREFKGSLTATQQGTADGVVFDSLNRTVTVKVAIAKLNTYLATLTSGSHPAIASGRVMCGLRGQTSLGSLALEDATRGGTEFTIP